ncbi:hypothetical protein [Dysgonomonas sp. 521]|uniref:hypothetical protein n=1 Tax=Dysgonomonas sp. 521 TaxID=2302932 RepID=UPI0013D35B51|nr:hypothetical protein [Dysgonomonas sp. 521]
MKKYIYIFLITTIFSLNISPLFSQDNKYLSPVIPPSPTSAIFSKYGNHQPSLSSGMINIPISLFEITADNFSLPFSLQYSTSGINISDRPFPVGYGWIFSPGLRVTRTVLGRPDDRFPFQSVYSSDNPAIIRKGVIDEQYYTNFGISRSELHDTQKDIFNVHLPSGNYTFLVNKVGNTYEAISPGNLLKFEFFIDQSNLINNVSAPINGLKITDENGIIYTFGMYANETVRNNYVETISRIGHTAWMLREVTLLNNTKINFTWKKSTLNNLYTPWVTTPMIIKDAKSSNIANCEDNSSPELSDDGGILDYTNYTEICMLEKVEFPAGTMNISYRPSQDPFISKIEVKDKNNTSRKTIDFIYGQGDSEEVALLKSLRIDQETYNFIYNSKRLYKNSTGLDYWGYYNGKNNQTMIPKMTLNLYGSYGNYTTEPNFTMQVGTADRSVDTAYMKASMLKRIEYPTGGFSEFEYEPHQFANQYPPSTKTFAVTPSPINKGGGLRVCKIITKERLGSTPTIKTYKYGVAENGLANIIFVPTLDTFIDELCIVESLPCDPGRLTTWAYRQLNINAMSSYSKYLIQGVPIWYSMVTEYVNDNKTENYFDYQGYRGSSYDMVKIIKKPYVHGYEAIFQDGPRQAEQIIYKKNGQTYSPLEKTIFSYDSPTSGGISNYMVNRNIINSYDQYYSCPDFRNFSDADIAGTICNARIYTVSPYQIDNKYYRLRSKETISMINASIVTTTEQYSYYSDKLMEKLTRGTSVMSI